MNNPIHFSQPILDAYGATNIGQRSRNEDYFLADTDLRLFIVADGMGGHTAGNFASCFTSGRMQDILTTIREMEHEKEETIGFPETGPCPNSGAASSQALISPVPEDFIRYAIWDANRNLMKMSEEMKTEKAMGTTIVGAFFFGDKVYFFNVGDSRGYRIYRGTIQQVTEDHSVVERRISEGELTPEELRFTKGKNILTRAIGSKKFTRPDIYVMNARIGDRYLLCSDGLSNIVMSHPGELTAEEQESKDTGKKLTMVDFVFKRNLKDVSEGLVDLAKRRGGRDNITAVAIELVREGSDMARSRRSGEFTDEVMEETISSEK